MAKVVGIHGIGQQVKGETVLHREWFPAMKDGLARAGWRDFTEADLTCAFYGDLFREPGLRSGETPHYRAEDVEESFEAELLWVWYEEASRLGEVPPMEPETRGLGRDIVQVALRALSRSHSFAGAVQQIPEDFLIANLKQVRCFMKDLDVKHQVIGRVADAVTEDTCVIVGHSLGSVVAYEALCANHQWNVKALVTIGSPLGIPNLIFDHLCPPPLDGLAIWPGVEVWTNVAEPRDIVALEKSLAPKFGTQVIDQLVTNEDFLGHDGRHYLTAKETGEGIQKGLA